MKKTLFPLVLAAFLIVTGQGCDMSTQVPQGVPVQSHVTSSAAVVVPAEKPKAAIEDSVTVEQAPQETESEAAAVPSQEEVQTVPLQSAPVLVTDPIITAPVVTQPAVKTQPVVADPTPAPAPTSAITSSAPNGTYVNVDGNTVSSPYLAPSAPSGATAQCRDGTYSFSQHRSGTCSHHGGVSKWL